MTNTIIFDNIFYHKFRVKYRKNGILLRIPNFIGNDCVTISGMDDEFVSRGFAGSDLPSSNPIDGKYIKNGNGIWVNSDGLRVILDLGHGNFEGCDAINGVPDDQSCKIVYP